MAKETDGRGRAAMNEADIEYLRNINTRPSPNAGHSIDPSKPGPDDDLAQSDVRRKGRSRLVYDKEKRTIVPEPSQSDAEPTFLGALKHIGRLTKQRDALIHVLQRCQMLASNMAMEHEGAIFNRWPIHHEPLRSDAKHLLPLISAALDTVPEPEYAQSNAEPVAWRWRYKTAPDEPGEWHAALAEFYGDDLIVESLYTAPPRPDHELSAIAAAIGSSRFMDPPDGGDVSLAEQVRRMREALERAEAARPDASAGLIEAAEMAEECASECLGVKAPLSAYALRDFAKVLRARAADRSEK